MLKSNNLDNAEVVEVNGEADQSQPCRVALTICTCNRPIGVTRAIQSLAQLKIPPNTYIELFVIDNSKDGNARKTVEMLSAQIPFKLHYISETVPGISQARNAGLACALEYNFDFMACIDDDMHVEPAWLVELLIVAKDTKAEVLISRLIYDFPETSPSRWWVDAAKRLDHRELRDREVLEQGRTCGCLVLVDCIRALSLKFDESFGLTGGEDSIFFDSILKNGGQIIFASESVSYEVLGPDRLTVKWWLRRWYRTGNTNGLINLSKEHYSRSRLILDGLIRVSAGFTGTVLSLPWLLTKRPRGMRAVRMVFRGLGYLAAATDIRYLEYKNGGRHE